MSCVCKSFYTYLHFYIDMFFIKPVTAEDQSKLPSTCTNVFKKKKNCHKRIASFLLCAGGRVSWERD